MSSTLITEKHLDKHLKIIKSGDENSSLELATEGNGARISGDLDVTSNLSADGNLKVSNGDLTMDSGKKIYLDSGGDTYILSSGNNILDIYVGGTNLLRLKNQGSLGDGIIIPAVSSLYFDGGSHTYIAEASGDRLEFVVGADEMLILDEDDQRVTIEADKLVYKIGSGGDEFSATDSAYAGCILGYTRIANDNTGSTNAQITVNSSSMTVIQTVGGTDLSIQFIVPPSGKVEIQCSFWMSAVSDGVKFSLSTGTSYAELGETHTYDADHTVFIDETDHNINTIKFAVTGLTPGTDTTYYLAGLASGAGVSIAHGRNRTTGSHFPPIILKAIALPATITTGE